MTNPAIDLLLTRRSVSANSLTEPGPTAAELEMMLRSATRVPDHKKLVPWRFLLFQGEARAAFGKILAAICRAEEKDPGAFRLENEEKRFLRAPLVIAVISRVVKNPGAPDWEQILSAGAACQNLILAATALGYGAQWITEWYGYSEGVRRALGLAENERVAGFVYVGTAKEEPDDRERPKLDRHRCALASVVRLVPETETVRASRLVRSLSGRTARRGCARPAYGPDRTS